VFIFIVVLLALCHFAWRGARVVETQRCNKDRSDGDAKP
jgi:hypothetical protein